MSRIFVPSKGPSDWQALLAEPTKQWKPNFSAHSLANRWEAQDGFPKEIRDTLAQHPALADADPLLIFPEWQVQLPGGVRPSQNDVWVLAKSNAGLVSIAVEGKAEESFDKTIADWRTSASEGKETRLAYLADVLGLAGRLSDSVRYQLVHRTASAIIEAERFGARQAVMLVHSFSAKKSWFEDFALFASQFGLKAEPGMLVSTHARNGIPLHLGWVSA